MKRGNKTGVLAFCAVLVSVLLVSVGSAQAQTPPEVASPAATSSVSTPTTTPSPSLVSPEATNTTISPTGTPSLNPQSSAEATGTTASPKVTSSASSTPTWNFWQSTAGNWIMFASGLIGVAITATVTWRVAKGSQKAQRELEQDKLRIKHEFELERKAEEETKHAQALEDGIKAYRERLKKELSHLSISDLSMVPSSLNLESFYLPLQVREKDPLYYPKEEEMAAAWEPTEVLRPSQAHLAKPAEIVLSPEDALARFPQMAVLGDPGAGKTTMLSYLALKMAQEAEPKLPYLAVYVKLGRFVDSGKDLLDFIADELDKRYGFPDRSYLEQQLDEGKAALLLDGLDEVVVEANPDEEVKNPYNSLTDRIDQLATRFHKAPIVVTYRRAWRGVSNRFQPLELLNFSWGQIQEFVKKWFESDPNKAEKLLEDLAGNLRMQTLAENPLILSLIAIVYQQDLKLPQRRAELYRRCAELLLQEWDDRRGVERFSQFKREDIQNLLIEVAWHFHCERKPYFHKDDLLQLISDFLASSNIGIPLEKNKVLLNEITGSSSLLKEAAHELYGFLHLTFQEYFAALAVKQVTEQGDRTRLQEVIKHRHEPWWEEVILLLAECMNDATPLLLGILGHPLGQSGDINQLVPEGKPLAVNDDLFDSDLLLAARCLVGKPTLQMQGLRDRIIAEVKNLLQTSPYKLDWERTTRVLVEINDKALIDELLGMLADNGINEEKRRSIASAFGKLADRSVAQRLLELLKRNPELDLFVRLSIIDALGALKATFAVSSLQEMLTTENSANAQEQIIRTLGVIANKGEASSLLDSLLDTTTDPKIKLTIAQALRNLKDESLTHRILEKLQDEKIEWQVRWLLTESLEGLQESAKDSLMKMLGSQAIDERVLVGIAATLGTWGVRESIPDLRNAIENKVVPPSWQQGYHTSSGYVWGRITRILNSLGDESVVPILKQAFIQSPAIPDKWATINAISEYKNTQEEIARQVLERARFPVDFGKETLLHYMRSLATKSLVPELRQLLTTCNEYAIDEWGQIGIINGLAQVADDRETVKALQEMIPVMQTTQNEYLRYAIYQALYRISQRARVRLRHDGQIEELQS